MFKFRKLHFTNLSLCFFIILISCQQTVNKTSKKTVINQEKIEKKAEVKSVAGKFILNDQNAIPFFFDYNKNNKENKVRIETKFGNIDLLLFNETPYHRSNFIYLTKMKYFDGTSFHRVVKDFIIQGGNSDSYEISKRRKRIGRYLLPPDTKKGFKHHRGVISIPSSDIDNPY